MSLANVSVEGPRGCGYRRVGGLYLVSKGLGVPCGRLPFETTVCPCCSAGIKPARAWTWIDPDLLVKNAPPCDKPFCETCPLSGHHGRKVGLLWVGEKFYPTPTEFIEEALRMGVSRRIPRLPRGFEVGKTWVLLGHRKGVVRDGKDRPAIVHAFCPERVEKVVRGDESDEDLQKLIDRGITPVIVQHEEEQVEIENTAAAVAQ